MPMESRATCNHGVNLFQPVRLKGPQAQLRPTLTVRATSASGQAPQEADGIAAAQRTGNECLASRASSVHTALRNCTGDEGGPFGFGDQVVDPKPPRAASAKSRGGKRRGKIGTMIMGLEPRGQAIAVDLGQLVRREEPFVQRKAAAFTRWHEPDDARVSSPDL